MQAWKISQRAHKLENNRIKHKQEEHRVRLFCPQEQTAFNLNFSIHDALPEWRHTQTNWIQSIFSAFGKSYIMGLFLI